MPAPRARDRATCLHSTPRSNASSCSASHARGQASDHGEEGRVTAAALQGSHPIGYIAGRHPIQVATLAASPRLGRRRGFAQGGTSTCGTGADVFRQKYVLRSTFIVGIVCAGTLVGASLSSAAGQTDPVKPRPERVTPRVAPLAVVPIGTRLQNLIRRSDILIVGARNDRRATTLMHAAGARALLTRIGLWAVPSSRIKSLIAKANRPGLSLIRFVELPSNRDEIVEPMPPRKPYAFTDPLASPTYSWHIYAVGANQVPTGGPGFPITVFDSGLDVTPRLRRQSEHVAAQPTERRTHRLRTITGRWSPRLQRRRSTASVRRGLCRRRAAQLRLRLRDRRVVLQGFVWPPIEPGRA